MFAIAWNNLTHEKGRFIVSVGGVAFAVVLIMLISALYAGWEDRITEYIESVQADFWVAQPGSADLSHSVSLLPQRFEPLLRETPGVDFVGSFIGRRISFDLLGMAEVPLYVVGFDPAAGRNGPIRLLRGSGDPGEKEIIVDQSFVDKYDVDLGDTLPLKKGEDWTIVGISEGSNQILYTYAFINISEAERLLDMQGLVNYYLVTISPGSDPGAVKRDIESSTEVQATSREDFIVDNKKIIKDTFLPIIYVLMIIAFAIGAAVIALTIYTATIEKSSEYGVLKALGFGRWMLYRVVFIQSLISGVLGFVIGISLALGIAAGVQRLEPSFITSFEMSRVLLVGIMTLGMACIAAWVPTHRITAVDPTEVFRA